MEKAHHSFADTLHEAHTDLLRELQELERAVSQASHEAPADLSERLIKVQSHLADHFHFEEEGGYMAPVVREEPRFLAASEVLLAEHGKLAMSIMTLVQEAGRIRNSLDALHEEVRAWISQVRQHESRENNLVQEAYYSSGATGD